MCLNRLQRVRSSGCQQIIKKNDSLRKSPCLWVILSLLIIILTLCSEQTSLYSVQSTLAIFTILALEANSSQIGAKRLQWPHLEEEEQIMLYRMGKCYGKVSTLIRLGPNNNTLHSVAKVFQDFTETLKFD